MNDAPPISLCAQRECARRTDCKRAALFDLALQESGGQKPDCVCPPPPGARTCALFKGRHE